MADVGNVPAVAYNDHDIAIGTDSVAGVDPADASYNSQTDDIALGNGARAIGGESIASGNDAITSGASTSAYGAGSIASGYQSSAYGTLSTASNDYSAAFGNSATASGAAAAAFGDSAYAIGDYSYAFGADTSARGDHSEAFGIYAGTYNTGDIAIGANSVAGVSPTTAAYSGQADDIAIGYAAQATGGNAVALGKGSIADVADTVSVGAAGSERRIVNVAAGTLGAASTDAVNGGQLAATNQQVTANTTAIAANTSAITSNTTNISNNTTAISGLANGIANGNVGPVRYAEPAAPTMPNGGVRTNDLTLVGGATGAVKLHNVADGKIAAGSTDAVNGGQVYKLALTAVNAVSYDTDAKGNRTNTLTLAGGNAEAPVTIRNVAAGAVNAESTEAVNGGQLYQTNQDVTAAQHTADHALALGQNSVQYDDESHSNVTLGDAEGAPVAVHNVAAGVADTDAVNVAQLNSGLDNAISQANAYTDSRMLAFDYDLRAVRRNANAGTASALAAAGLPQAYEPGKGMIAIAGGTYQGQSAIAFGFSEAFSDEHTVIKVSASYDSRSKAGGSVGMGYQF